MAELVRCPGYGEDKKVISGIMNDDYRLQIRGNKQIGGNKTSRVLTSAKKFK
ncbi:hypothetical protein CCACVL1_00027 [Corchorus capsularis]|uniref:Uncharacterized protein n=1 Tax=Corchorus capsularis TaxID=210143 RepID=A0A1R3KZ15_COCAP|nr:hypothetical protein CCACVL1_00027 [Corchorus capsularis]